MDTWEAWEAKTQRLLAAQQWEACIQHISSVNEEHRNDKKYLRSIERTCKKIVTLPTYQEDIRIVRKLAYIYYTACSIHQDKPILKQDKQYCERQAAQYFSVLLKQQRQPRDVYYYAQLLYRHANQFFLTESVAAKVQKKEKAYDLYEEVLQKIENEKVDRHARLYSQACYALGRCGLELLSGYSVLLQEIALVTDMPPLLFRNKQTSMERLRRIHACLDTVRAIEHLPRRVPHLSDIRHVHTSYAYTDHIYYLLGKAFDYAWKFGLCNNKVLAYQWAERYYTYACEINYHKMTGQKNKRISYYMYMALVNLYIRKKDKRKCAALWQRYQLSQHIPRGCQQITGIRWAIIERNYEKARNMLMACQKENNWQEGLSKQRVIACINIVNALQGKIEKEYTAGYSDTQIKILLKVIKQGNMA